MAVATAVFEDGLDLAPCVLVGALGCSRLRSVAIAAAGHSSSMAEI